jgi:hypothetical protein
MLAVSSLPSGGEECGGALEVLDIPEELPANLEDALAGA